MENFLFRHSWNSRTPASISWTLDVCVAMETLYSCSNDCISLYPLICICRPASTRKQVQPDQWNKLIDKPTESVLTVRQIQCSLESTGEKSTLLGVGWQLLEFPFNSTFYWPISNDEQKCVCVWNAGIGIRSYALTGLRAPKMVSVTTRRPKPQAVVPTLSPSVLTWPSQN